MVQSTYYTISTADFSIFQVWVMCGDFLMCATEMAVVSTISEDFLTPIFLVNNVNNSVLVIFYDYTKS